MALVGNRIFLRCKSCGHEIVFHKNHREALAKRLQKAPAALTSSDILRESRSFRCKRCGAYGVDVREEERKPPQIRYVASGREVQGEPVFHRDTCGWVGHVHKAKMIEFQTRDEAVMAGYRPCRICRP